MRFTPQEVAILSHRLETGDAIGEVYADTMHENGTDEEREEAASSANDAADRLLSMLQETGCLDTAIIQSDQLLSWVLQDAVNGNVWVGCMIGNYSPMQIGKAIAAGDRLAEKCSAVCGMLCEFPDY